MTTPLLSTGQKTLLQIIQEVCGDLGLNQPSAIIGNSDNQIRQLLVHANRIGEDLMDRDLGPDGWPVLRKEWTFNLVGFEGFTGNTSAGAPQITGMNTTANIAVGMVCNGNTVPWGAHVLSIDSPTQVTLDLPAQDTSTDVDMSFGNESYAIPADVHHFIPQTGWDRSFRWQNVGPLSPQEWQVLKSGISPTGPRIRFRIMDGKLWVNPVPASQDLMAWEYYSTGWCQSGSGTPQTQWLADTDTPVLQDRLFILGIQARFLQKKGLDSTNEAAEYENSVAVAAGRAGLSRSLPLNARAQTPHLLGPANTPDTGYGA